MKADFSQETMKAKIRENGIYNVLEEKQTSKLSKNIFQK